MTISFKKSKIYKQLLTGKRDVAQLGSASGLGPEGRRFESCHPDHLKIKALNLGLFYVFKINLGLFLKKKFFSFISNG